MAKTGSIALILFNHDFSDPNASIGMAANQRIKDTV
jgi:hypothetical protein